MKNFPNVGHGVASLNQESDGSHRPLLQFLGVASRPSMAGEEWKTGAGSSVPILGEIVFEDAGRSALAVVVLRTVPGRRVRDRLECLKIFRGLL